MILDSMLQMYIHFFHVTSENKHHCCLNKNQGMKLFDYVYFSLNLHTVEAACSHVKLIYYGMVWKNMGLCYRLVGESAASFVFRSIRR